MADAVESLAQDQVLRIVRDFWREFDLDSRRAALDAQGLELQEAHKRCLGSRKVLQEQTRAFKARDEAGQTASLAGLMKLYQKEVDTLTRRARASDAAFLTLYKALYEAPDPAAALDAALAALTERSSEARKSGGDGDLEELEALREEISTLKNQDVTVRKLEAQLEQWHAEADARVAERLAAREVEGEERVQRRLGELSEREHALEERLGAMRSRLEQSQAVADEAERRVFEAERRAEEAIAAARSEQALLAEDDAQLEAQRVALRSENASLRRRLQDLEEAQRAAAGASGMAGAAGLADGGGQEVTQMMGLVASERAAKEEYRLEAENLGRRLREAAAQRQRDEQAAHAAAEQLAAERDARPTVEAFAHLRRELQLLQQLEFNVLPEEEAAEASAGAGAGGGRGGATAEQLFIRKARKLEGEILAHKRRAEAAETAASGLRQSLVEAKNLSEQRQRLIVQLENDLSAASSVSMTSPKAVKAAGLQGTVTPEADDADEAEALRGLLSLTPPPPPSANTPTGTPGAGGTPRGAGNDSVLSIVTSQRDRFRQKIQELERQLHAQRDRTEGHGAREKRLKADNLALYEKIRYLQHQLGAAGGNRAVDTYADAEAGAGPKTLENPHAEVRYRHLYEASRDPFATFTMVEKRRKLDELNFSEKILLHMSGIFLKSKQMRMFLFCYMLGLHGLVFFTTYYATHFCTGSDFADGIAFGFGDQHLPQGVDWNAHSEHIHNLKNEAASS